MIIWLIGISGAGKTTIGRHLSELLRANGRPVLFLDGDQLRDVWGDALPHDMSSRRRNHERISRLCALLNQDPSIDMVVPALSIFPDLRLWNRENLQRYVEIFLDVPIEEVMRRDQKSIYARALRGELHDVAGVDIPFPRPDSADFVVSPPESLQLPDVIARRIFDHLAASGHLALQQH